MNREIKFRAISEETDDMRFGSLTVEYDGTCHINWWVSLCIEPENNYYEPTPFLEVVKRDTIGQFTGLKDKNGKDIYEGDIVIVKNKPYVSNMPVVVVWGKKSYGWSLKFNCGNHYEHKPLIKYYSLPSSKDIEIIGNIHENPELLQP